MTFERNLVSFFEISQGSRAKNFVTLFKISPAQNEILHIFQAKVRQNFTENKAWNMTKLLSLLFTVLHINFEITDDPWYRSGYQQCNLFTNYTILALNHILFTITRQNENKNNSNFFKSKCPQKSNVVWQDLKN